MQHFFLAIYSFANRKKFLAVAFLIMILSGSVLLGSRLKFSEDITRLIPASDQSNITAKVMQQMNFSDKISVLITRKNNATTDDLTEFADQFLANLDRSCKPFIAKVQGKVDDRNIEESFGFVYSHLPLFLDKDDFQVIENRLNSDSISHIVENNYKSLITPTGLVSRDFIVKDPLGISLIALNKWRQMSVGDDFELLNGYVVTKDKTRMLLFITPKLPANETDNNTLFIHKIEEIKNNLNTQYKGNVRMSYFGATPVAVANATQIKADVRNTSLFAALCLIFILIFFYRNITTPIIIFIPSIFGAAFALAVLYFAKGTISAISLGISSILLGETTDYSIYVLTHLSNKKDIRLLYKDISKPLILCGMTTSITFLCLYFVKSEALQDLGLFAAISVVATSIFSLVLIPLLYRLKPHAVAQKLNLIDRLGTYGYSKNKWLVGSVLLVLVVFFFSSSKVTFNNDLRALNYVPTELKIAENELEKMSNGNMKSIYLATYGDNAEAVLKQNNAIFKTLCEEKKAGQINSFSSIGGLVFSKEEQLKKISDWNLFWTVDKKLALKNALISKGNAFGFKATTYQQFYASLDKQFATVPLEEYQQLKSLFLDEFVAQKNGFSTISTVVKVPNQNRDTFVNAIKKESNLVVIDRQQANESFLGTLKNNFERLVDYSFIAVFIVLFLAFRRIELVIVSIIPILISWVFTTGIMSLFHLQFNIINIIVCTLIFGIGVDYSIFMTIALQKEHTYGRPELPTYRTSILLSVATTILGIGVLIFAQHPALKSISIIAIVGILSALLITFTIQPLVFDFFVTSRVNKGKAPFQFRTLLHGVLSFCYYGLGGVLVSIYSLTLMRVIPIQEDSKMRGFRFVISKFMKSVLYTNPFVTKKVINQSGEKFQKPAVIIANHTSFLDILAIGMLSPRTIYLVSDWVYHSPIFGPAVKRAGFYPVSEGIEGGVEHLRKKVEEGYSLIVFPEGTRSKSNQIQRFHKGAFFLADHFGLDILPVLIHGNSEVLPKGDFIIYDGSITVTILERIPSSKEQIGVNYADKTKQISSFFRNKFAEIRIENEGANYFKKKLINSFDYKEESIIQSVRNDFRLHAEMYYSLNSYLGNKSKILHWANDFGQLDVLLTLQEPQRKIVSLIADADRRSVAKTNYWLINRTIVYPESLENVGQVPFDIVLISTSFSGNNLEQLVSKANSIILLNNSSLISSLIQFGFFVVTEDLQIVVLKKQ